MTDEQLRQRILNRWLEFKKSSIPRFKVVLTPYSSDLLDIAIAETKKSLSLEKKALGKKGIDITIGELMKIPSNSKTFQKIEKEIRKEERKAMAEEILLSINHMLFKYSQHKEDEKIKYGLVMAKEIVRNTLEEKP